jgi:hypothetical protein
MNDWWKLALGGAAGAGLLAATGGLAAPGLFGAGGSAAGAAGTAGAAAGAGAAEAGTAAATGGLLAGDAAAAGGAGAAGAGAGTMAFVTPPVMGAAAPLDGVLAGTSFGYGSPAALADAGATVEAPGLLAQAQGYAGQAGKAASAYGTVSHAMGGGQPQQQAPQGRPVFQGDAAPIAPQGMGAPPGGMQQQGLLGQSGGTAGGMLRNIAQQRLGRRF